MRSVVRVRRHPIVAVSLAGFVAVAALAGLVMPTAAITNGEIDGTGHPEVGALAAEFDGVKELICSGFLVSPTVFVTASHCTAYLQAVGVEDHDVWVTFDPAFSDAGTFFRGTMHTNPQFNQTGSDPHDLAVVVLDREPGISPASLPAADWADSARVAGTLRGEQFVAVGYGASARAVGSGPPTFVSDGVRRFANETFGAWNHAWLRLSQNPATANGGGCYGDSGGPNFIGDTTTVASITVTGDAVCRATNTTYRLDTGAARAFLGQFVALP